MPTRELIHVSFGSLPAHLSSQFFNTQTGYFNYSPSAPEPLVDHDISWQEGVDGRGQERYTPRWLVYDVKDGFEGLRRQETYDDEGDDDEQGRAAQSTSGWAASAQIMKTHGEAAATPFRRLANRERKGEDVDWEAEIEREFAYSDDEDERAEEQHGEAELPEEVLLSNPRIATESRRPIKPWSSRLLFEFNPRTLVPVTASGGLPLHSMSSSLDGQSNAPEGVQVFETFEQGWSRAKEWDRDNDTLDTSLRYLLEASDHPQGFNLLQQSTDAWSGFSHWNLEQLIDEYPKLEKLVWSLRWGAGLGDVSSTTEDDHPAKLRAARIRSMNEALSLIMLGGEGTSLFTPLNLPQWPHDETPQWARHLRSTKRQKLYEDESYWSSLMSSQFETATLGMRLRNSPTSATTLASHLNWRGDTRLAQLGGCLPIPLLAPMEEQDSKPFDPVEALLASRGYNPRPNQSRHPARFDPSEIGRVGAKEIVKSWTSFSSPPTSGRRKGKSNKHTPQAIKPFALQAVARDASQGAQAITESSTEQWITGSQDEGGLGMEEPWGRSLFTPLDQPVTASSAPIYDDLTSTGRPWPRSSSSHPTSHRPKSLPILSTLSTTPSSHTHIMHAIDTLTMALRSHTPLSSFGLVGSSSAPRGAVGGISSGQAANDEIEGAIGGRDGIKELLERAEEMRSAYEEEGGGRGGEEEEDEGRGTDEEWGDTEQQGDDLDWD